jgi:DNA-binding transcriptional MerR regulator
MLKAEKVYYSIGEVAGLFNVNASLIRFWEQEFAILKPKKNKKGNRLFTQRDLRYLHMIYHLVKEKGYTLKGANDALKEDFEQLEARVFAVQTLHKARQFLLELDAGFADRLKKK